MMNSAQVIPQQQYQQQPDMQKQQQPQQQYMQPQQHHHHQQPQQQQMYQQQPGMQMQQQPQQQYIQQQQQQPQQQQYMQPGQQPMAAPAVVAPMVRDIASYPDLLVKQTKKDWVMELIGFPANSEFNISTMGDKSKNIFYAAEDTPFCTRCVCRGNRPYVLPLYQGYNKNGTKLAEYVRPLRCVQGACKCCCYQEMQTTVNGNYLGKVTETFRCCVPKFNILDADGKVEYFLSQPTCCGGCCINFCAEGCCSSRVPFYLFKPDTQNTVKENQVGHIVKVKQNFCIFETNCHANHVHMMTFIIDLFVILPMFRSGPGLQKKF
jgi:hypothetical protein